MGASELLARTRSVGGWVRTSLMTDVVMRNSKKRWYVSLQNLLYCTFGFHDRLVLPRFNAQRAWVRTRIGTTFRLPLAGARDQTRAQRELRREITRRTSDASG